LSVTEEAVSLMSGTAPLIVVSLAVGSVLEVRAVDEEFTRAASVLAEEVGGAGFLSLAEDSLVAELVTLESEIVGVMVDDIVEATTSLVVETGVVTAEGVDVGPIEAAVEVAEVVEEVVEAELTSIALVAEVLDLVMVKGVS